MPLFLGETANIYSHRKTAFPPAISVRKAVVIMQAFRLLQYFKFQKVSCLSPFILPPASRDKIHASEIIPFHTSISGVLFSVPASTA